ncbi:MAG TPA: hypothetical protein VMM57_10820 [Bacteroidota bacterium]|nr:hypothetical protein [Bacteroidota bacterium]
MKSSKQLVHERTSTKPLDANSVRSPVLLGPMIHEGHRELSTGIPQNAMTKRILLFSPDADLARAIGLSLQSAYCVVLESDLERLEQRMKAESPDLILIDLFTFSKDIERQLEVVKRNRITVPVIILRAYMAVSADVNNLINSISDVVFYKPVDVGQLSNEIQTLMKSRRR